MKYESMSPRAKVSAVVGEPWEIADDLNPVIADEDIALISVLYGDMYLVQLHEDYADGKWGINLEFEDGGDDRFYDETDAFARELEDGDLLVEWPGEDNRYLVEVKDD